MKFSLLLHICLISFLIIGCRKDDDSKTEIAFNYLPLVEGTEYIYKVDSVDFNRIPFDSTTYWQREVVGGEVEALDGHKYFEIFVYHRDRWEKDWRKIRTDLARNTDVFSERYTENVMYRKLVYPLSYEQEWEGAPNNDIELLHGRGVLFDKTRFDKIHQVDFTGNRGFDSTLTVIQFERYDFIDRFNYREQYANNIGLYHKYELNVNYQDPNPQGGTDTADYVAKFGYERKQVMVDYNAPLP